MCTQVLAGLQAAALGLAVVTGIASWATPWRSTPR
jgi:hypothetical protein